MKKIFEKMYDLRTSDFDKFNHIRPSAVLDLFQDVAGRHAEEINVGHDAMKNRSYFWVLVKTKFRIISQPEIYQKVVAKTWPLEPNKFIYRREYTIESEEGKKLIIGSSEWVVVHSEKRRLVSAPDLYPFTDGFHTEMNFEPRIEKISNHVNNTKYADFVLDSVNPDDVFNIDVFQIDYRKEVLQGDKLEICHKIDNKHLIAKGMNEDGNVMFACDITYK